MVLVAGPSSSGKTTTTKRLSIHLLANLIRPQMISLDNYFVDREHTPRDASGDYVRLSEIYARTDEIDQLLESLYDDIDRAEKALAELGGEK